MTEPKKKNLAVAILLQLFLPGLGYIYLGRIAAGVLLILLCLLVIFTGFMLFPSVFPIFGAFIMFPSIIHLVILADKQKKAAMDLSTKKCPYCAETIKMDAKICKYCRSSLQGEENHQAVGQ